MTGLFASLPRQVPLDIQIACVERELDMRRRNYPRWVAAGKMTPGKAEHETAAMEAVLATLKAQEGTI